MNEQPATKDDLKQLEERLSAEIRANASKIDANAKKIDTISERLGDQWGSGLAIQQLKLLLISCMRIAGPRTLTHETEGLCSLG